MTTPTSMIVKQRIKAAIRGAFIADAASMGTHWIYNPQEMAKSVLDIQAPEFKSPATPKFYSADEFPGHYTAGMLSPYGEQLLFVTEHVASTSDLKGETMSQEMLKWATSFGGRPDGALKAFLENMASSKKPYPDCGADDSEAHIYMKVVPVVGRYAGSPDLVDKVTQAIRVHQNNEKAIAFGITAARLLEAVILGAPLQEALETVEQNIAQDLKDDFKDDVVKALARGKKAGTEEGKTLDDILKEVSHEIMAGKEDSPFYDLAGRSCALPGSFIGPIALFHKYSSANNNNNNRYEPALRENILGSGDTCSRAVFVGAVLAAAAVEKEDTDTIPSSWSDKMDAATLKRVDAAVQTIIAK